MPPTSSTAPTTMMTVAMMVYVELFARKHGMPKEGKFSIKLGFVDGKVISKEEVEAYAKLPSKETLLSQLVFMLQSPIQRLAIAISEIEKKQNESA